MKRALAVLACLVLVCGFAGCGKTVSTVPHGDADGSSTTTTLATSTQQQTTGSTTSTQTSQATTDTPPDTTDEIYGVNRWRLDYDLGTCRHLRGNVAVVLFFMNDSQSTWEQTDMLAFTQNEVEPALAFLEKAAKGYGVELELTVQHSYGPFAYDGTVSPGISGGQVTTDVLSQAARGQGYTSDKALIAALKAQYGTEVVCLTVFNKNGTAYAINPQRGETIQLEEHCILFTCDRNASYSLPGYQASVVAHEMLHLFGAEDFYTPATRKAVAKSHYPKDIMLIQPYNIYNTTIEEATAFYVGWTDEAPLVLFHSEW